MSKFCFRCGGVSENDADTCACCGIPFDAPVIPVPPAPTPEPAQEAPQAPQPEPIPEAPVKKTRKKLVILAAALICVAVLGGLLHCFFFFSSSCTDPIDLYFAAMYEGKIDAVEKLAPKEYWNWRAAASDMSRDACIKEAQEWARLTNKSIKKQFGEDFFCTYQVADKEEMTDKALRELAEILERDYEISARSVKKGYTVTIDLNFNGDEQNGQEITVVQIGYRWYLVERYFSPFGNRAYFPVGGGPAMLA